MSRAAENGDERIVKLLLENGALPDFGDEEGQVPLSRAIEKGSIETHGNIDGFTYILQ